MGLPVDSSELLRSTIPAPLRSDLAQSGAHVCEGCVLWFHTNRKSFYLVSIVPYRVQPRDSFMKQICAFIIEVSRLPIQFQKNILYKTLFVEVSFV